MINIVLLFFLKKMRRDITDKIQFGQNLNTLDDALGVESVDYLADFVNLLKKLDKLKLLYDNSLMNANLLKYIQGISKIMYQV